MPTSNRKSGPVPFVLAQSNTVLWTPQRIKDAPWRYYQFSVELRSARYYRKVAVVAPLAAAAFHGVGAQRDEELRQLIVNPIEATIERYVRGRLKAKKNEVAFFLADLGKLLAAGEKIGAALDRCAQNAKTPYFRGVIGMMALYLNHSGKTIVQAMELFPDCFDDQTTALLEAGRNASKLDLVLQELAKTALSALKHRRRIKSALFYPKIVGLSASCLFVTIVTVIFPRLLPQFKGYLTELPLTTRTVEAIGDVIMGTHGAILALPVIIYIVIKIKWDDIAATPFYQELTP